MNDQEFENYLALLGGMLRLGRKQREMVARELRDHLEQHVADQLERGVAKEAAIRHALADLGDAASLAASFARVVNWRRRRVVMRCTLGSVVGALLILLGVNFFQGQPDLPDKAHAQQPAQGAAAGLASGSGPGGLGAEGLGAADGVARAIEEEEVGPLAEAEKNSQSRRKLAMDMDVEFTDMPLTDCLAFVGEFTQVQFYVDRRQLTELGLSPQDIPVTLSLHAVPASMVLDLMLDQAGGEIAYYLRSGVLIVTQKNAINQELSVYPVTLHGPDGERTTAKELSDLIMKTIGSGEWQDQGGSGNIVPFQNMLIVLQTPDVHEQIRKLLLDLEAAQQKMPRVYGSTGGGEGVFVEDSIIPPVNNADDAGGLGGPVPAKR